MQKALLTTMVFFWITGVWARQNDTINSEDLDEIIIDASVNKINIRKPEMSVNKLTSEEIKKMPVDLGETDFLKSIHLLLCVVNSGAVTSRFNVRGSEYDQNLLLLDQTSVYGSSHLYGFFSVFNNDAVSNIKLYKGGIPARYGGRASSVLEINQKNGDFQQFKATDRKSTRLNSSHV